MENSEKRDELVTRVRKGELTPEEAEDEASRLGLEPLRQNPDPEDFDPMNEPHWTLPMAVAWIAYRTPEAVREYWDVYRSKCWDWIFKENWSGPDRKAYSGHVLELRDRATLEDLKLDEIIGGFLGDDGSREISVPEAIKALKDALGIPILPASGVNSSTGKREALPADIWQDLEFGVKDDRDIVRSRPVRGGSDYRFEHLTVPSGAMMQLWSSKADRNPRQLPPLMAPDGPGLMPLFRAAQWIATEGGAVEIDPEDVSNWERSYRTLLDHVASGQVRISGRRDGLRQPIDGTIFADCMIDYPYQNTTIEMVMSEEYILRSHDFVDEELWRRGFDDRIENRRGKLWIRLMVDKADIARNWPFDSQAVQRPPEKPHARSGRKPKYDWAAARAHIMDQFEHHGPLSPDDPDWSCQADVEKAIKAFFVDTIRQEPATSTVREKAREFIAAFEAGNGR